MLLLLLHRCCFTAGFCASGASMFFRQPCVKLLQTMTSWRGAHAENNQAENIKTTTS
jgi:hypothetical protein